MARRMWLRAPVDITKVLSMMFARGEVDPETDAFAEIELRVSRAREVIKSVGVNGIGRPQWMRFYIEMGSLAWNLIVERGGTINSNDFADFLMGKHKRYGVAPLEAWREVGVLVRLDSKVGRYREMLDDPALDTVLINEQSESMDDTLRDIIGYCVIGWHMIDRPNWDARKNEFVREEMA